MDLSVPITIVAPSGVDGRGETAQLNGAVTDTHFVGYLFDASGFDGPAVRTSQDNIVEGHGAVFGSFFHGPRSFTLEVQLARASTWANSFTRRDKLYRAFNAMQSDGTVTWTETGGTARRVSFRREQPPRGPDKEGKVLLSGICADPRIVASSESNSGAASTSPSATNSGNVGASPRIEIASPSATVNITNSTTSETLTLTGLDGSGTLIVDFGARTVTRGGVNKYSKVSFPSSVWWELAPGANSISLTNAGVVYWRNSWL